MKEITLEELLEAGCHFGHQVTRQNPKARDYIFEARDNIHIIDLALTKKGLDEAAAYVKDLAKRNGTIVVVGSKRQAQQIIRDGVKKAKETLKAKNIADGLYSVTSRWIGGTLTNADEVKKNYKKLKDLEAMLKNDFEKAKYTKKEIGMWDKERAKLEFFYGGIVDIATLPDALFIIDTHTEYLAVREAHSMGIKTVGIVDTNADPTLIDYVIPANDDAVGSIELIVNYIFEAWVEGREESVKVTEAVAESHPESAVADEGSPKNQPEVSKETPKEAAKAEAKPKKKSPKGTSPSEAATVKKVKEVKEEKVEK